jgi:hypothetical protein
MNKIARLSQVALASAALIIPMATHAAWADWTHQVYVNIGGGVQYVNNKTKVDNFYTGLHQDAPPAGFHAHRFEGTTDYAIGLANTQGINYVAVQVAAVNTSAYNNANFNQLSTGADGTQANTSYSFVSSMPWRYELDGIFGRYIQPNVLAFVKVGGTMGRIFSTATLLTGPTIPGGTLNNGYTTINMNKILYGAVVGAGANYVINSHWSAGAELDFVQFFNGHKSDANYTMNGTAIAPWGGFNGANFQYRQCNTYLKANVAYTF